MRRRSVRPIPDQVRDDKVDCADIIFVMETAQRTKLKRRFGAHLKRARVICLDIPDDYAFMQPELVALLERKVGAVLK
jgi:predicted protein tyrosine phosphatase